MSPVVFKGKGQADVPQDLRCSFCDKPHSEDRRMVAGPGGAAICAQCLVNCSKILADQKPDERPH